MNSVGDEAVRRELLARLQTVGAGMSGGRRYVGGGVSDYGGKGPSAASKAAAARNPYLTYKSVVRSGLFNGTYDDYLASQGLARAAPKVRSGKPRGRPKKFGPMTEKQAKKKPKKRPVFGPETKTQYLSRRRKEHEKSKFGPVQKIFNPVTKRYVLLTGKVGKRLLAGGNVYE